MLSPRWYKSRPKASTNKPNVAEQLTKASNEASDTAAKHHSRKDCQTRAARIEVTGSTSSAAAEAHHDL